MADDLKRSKRRARRSTRSIETSITPAEAASLLTSALSYCEKAGLKITGYNENGNLRLSIAGVEYYNGRIRVITPTAETSHTNFRLGVTPVGTVTPKADGSHTKPEAGVAVQAESAA